MFSRYSPLSNPAFLTQENYIDLRGVFNPLPGNSELFEGGLTVPIGLYQSLGASWINENATIDNPTVVTSPSGGATSPTFQNNFIMGTYAYNLWKGLSLGINLNLALQNAFGEQQTGYGADVGLTYRLIKSPVIGNHILGVNAQNLIAPVLKSEISGNEETYSRNLRITLQSTYWERQIESNFDFCIKDFLAAAAEFRDSSNTKNVAQNIGWEFTGRIGFCPLRTLGLYGLFGVANTGFEYWGLALTGNIPSITGRDFNFGYQYNMIQQEPIASNTVYLRLELGDSRELAYARKMAHSMDVAPNEIYLKAVKLYSEGKYWDAYFLFSQIMNDYPDFFKNDWVIYFTGSCQENLDMREIAAFSYQSLKGEFPQSSATPHADLGLMRLFYRGEDYGRAAQQFSLLDKPEISDSLKYTAYFILGQVHMARKDYSKALEVFLAVPPDHSDYLFAQHSAAVALLSINKPMDAATHLKTCIDDATATTVAQKEIINRSNLFLAYILYEGLIQEERPLSKVLTLLRKIPQTSAYYNEGLLLQGSAAARRTRAPTVLPQVKRCKPRKTRCSILKACLSRLMVT